MTRWPMLLVALVFAGCTATSGGGSSSASTSSSSSGAMDAGTATPDAGTAVAVEPGVWPLEGYGLELATYDLAPLVTLTQGAQVVAVGESIHTSAGFYHLRNRVFAGLITHGGFAAVAFEAGWENVERYLKPYIETCTGSAQEAAKALPSIWWDVATPEFLTWWCQYNQAHPGQAVTAFGFDIRQPWFDFPGLRTFLQQHATTQGQALGDALTACLGTTHAGELAFFTDPAVRDLYAGAVQRSDMDRQACEDAATAMRAHLVDNRATLEAAAGANAVTVALLRVSGMRAFDETIYWLSRGNLHNGNGARDPAMFEAFNVQRGLVGTAARTLLWAHNGHILKNARDLRNSQWTGVDSLGSLLGDTLGASYVAIGQYAMQTDYHWFDGPLTLPTPTPSSLEALLNGYGLPLLFVDLATATSGATPAITPEQSYAVTLESPLVPLHHYDALLFHARSERAVYFENPGWVQ